MIKVVENLDVILQIILKKFPWKFFVKNIYEPKIKDYSFKLLLMLVLRDSLWITVYLVSFQNKFLL